MIILNGVSTVESSLKNQRRKNKFFNFHGFGGVRTWDPQISLMCWCMFTLTNVLTYLNWSFYMRVYVNVMYVYCVPIPVI